MHAATFTFFGQIREKGERHDLSGHAYNISHNKLLRYPQKSKVKLWRGMDMLTLYSTLAW